MPVIRRTVMVGTSIGHTGREIRFRKTCKTERAAQIELGRLLAQAAAGRQPESAVTVAQLLDQYVSTAGWDVSTRDSNLGYIRRTISPALGSVQVRKVRGPLLDTLYARLMRCPRARAGLQDWVLEAPMSEQVQVDGPLEGLRT